MLSDVYYTHWERDEIKSAKEREMVGKRNRILVMLLIEKRIHQR